MAEFSKSQVDRLGDRLKKGPHSETDLRMLDEYRDSFSQAFETVLGISRRKAEAPTGRIAKSTRSIVEKLRRESIRLSQMQDIAGCRVIVADIVEQDHLISALKNDFPDMLVMDRRENPSHGYRAVHVITSVKGKHVEIQVRTFVQHLWAEFSEKASDVLDSKIKYGGGPKHWQNFLSRSSECVQLFERLEFLHFSTEKVRQKTIATKGELETAITEYLKETDLSESDAQELQTKIETVAREDAHSKAEIEQMRADLLEYRNLNVRLLSGMIQWLDKRKDRGQ